MTTHVIMSGKGLAPLAGEEAMSAWHAASKRARPLLASGSAKSMAAALACSCISLGLGATPAFAGVDCVPSGDLYICTDDGSETPNENTLYLITMDEPVKVVIDPTVAIDTSFESGGFGGPAVALGSIGENGGVHFQQLSGNLSLIGQDEGIIAGTETGMSSLP